MSTIDDFSDEDLRAALERRENLKLAASSNKSAKSSPKAAPVAESDEDSDGDAAMRAGL
jgi:hypothetical protein